MDEDPAIRDPASMMVRVTPELIASGWHGARTLHPSGSRQIGLLFVDGVSPVNRTMSWLDSPKAGRHFLIHVAM